MTRQRKTPHKEILSCALFALGMLALLSGCSSHDTKPAEVAVAPAKKAPPLVILISIDGMRYDYIDLYKPPVLSALAQRGSHAQRLTPCYPSLTFPNHYSIVTGLYPEHHGIVANSMYEPEWKANFGIGVHPAAREARWWGGEPIWNTVERQGLIAACNFWPGADAPINNRRPTIWLPFVDNLPHAPRIQQTLSWLDLPEEKRPAFITLYFSDVDHAGHKYGPTNDQVRDALMGVDTAIGQFLDGLRARNLADIANIIVVSDHGMAATSPERLIVIEDYLPGQTLDGVAQVDTAGTHAGLRPLGTTSAIALRDFFRNKNPHLSAYLKAELPARFHYSASRRIPPVVLIPEEGWLVTTRARTGPNARPTPLGSHGYDPRFAAMGATFIATGPAFKKSHTFAEAKNIDIYNLICAIFKIQPAPNDGGDALAQEILLKKK